MRCGRASAIIVKTSDSPEDHKTRAKAAPLTRCQSGIPCHSQRSVQSSQHRVLWLQWRRYWASREETHQLGCRRGYRGEVISRTIR